jgi:hypothetical protein
MEKDVQDMRDFSESFWYQSFTKAFNRAYKQYLLGEWI